MLTGKSSNSFLLLLVFAAACCNAAPQASIAADEEDSLEIHDRVRRNGEPTNYWWIPGVPSSPSSTDIHRVSCGDPGEPAFGSSLFESVHAGAIVVHSCNPGHRLDGAKLRLCQSNGQWTPQLPTCVFVDCGDPGEPKNGNTWVGSTFLGSIVKYKCNPGFSLVGDSFRTCQANGQWNGYLPSCQPQACPKLPSPINGQVLIRGLGTGAGTGAVATYSCTTGFSLIGSDTRVCGQNGVWQGTAPICQAIDCGILLAPRNGGVSFKSTQFGSVAFYSCNEGFRLVGAETQTCQDNGEWSGTAPTCQALTCSNLSDIENGHVIVSSNIVGSIAHYVCNSGFDLVGDSSRVCQASGEWSNEEPECKEVNCRQLQDPTNGLVTLTGTSVNSQATYTCDLGFRLVGSRTRLCQSDGEWSGEDPTCHVVDCGRLDAPENGRVFFSSTSFHSVANYVCDDGFDLIGSSQRTCQADGTWSDEDPVCRVIGCGDLGDPINGQVFLTGTAPGALATYICDNGFRLDGSRNRVCQVNGGWSAEEPTCTRFSCGRLDSPENGRVSLSGVSPGSVATYTCNVGFDLVGVTTRVCLSSGQWSGDAPVCQAIHCPDLPNPQYGRVTINFQAVGGVATYSCDNGFILVGSSTRTCQIHGVWSGAEPTCSPSGCDTLPDPDNGQVDLSGTDIGSTATYSCDVGFLLQGSRTRVCLGNGLWSGQEPSCIAIDCGPLFNIQDGSVVLSGTSFSSTATYNCNEGFSLVGATTRTCQANGAWSGSEPFCTPSGCDFLSDIENGQVRLSGTDVGDSAIYSCDVGFVLQGSHTRVCQRNGQWSSQEPVCTAIDCGPLFNIQDGSVVLSGTSFSSTATYNCNEGFSLVGATTRTCQANGAWSGSEPFCTPSGCDFLSDIENGQVSLSGTDVGASAIYSCDVGFVLQGSHTRICQRNGQWSSQEPVCTAIDCGPLFNIQDGSVVLSGTSFSSTATYNCNEGFSLVGATTRTCQANGAWSGSEPFCTPLSCNRLDNPQNGRVDLSGTTVGSIATYSCTPGFQLKGQQTRQCLVSGSWSGQEPTCDAVNCPDLPDPVNGRVTLSGNRVGSTATYRCTTGFGLVGISPRLCLPNGQWTGDAPTCQPAECPELQAPENGVIRTTGMQFGDTATYSCLPGFELIGNEVRTCQANGFWLGSVPFCQAVQCGFLTAPENGQLVLSGTIFGSTATYSCLPGFSLVGTATRTCQVNGEWSGHAPTCTAVDCGDLQDPSNGEVTLTGTVFGSLAIYSCDQGFTLVGSITRSCQANGQWSNQPPTCVSQRCDVLDPPQNGRVNINSFTIGSTATYSCFPGFTLVGQDTRTCQANGVWTGSAPFCQAVTCDVLTAQENGRVTLTGTQVGDTATYSCLPGFDLQGTQLRTCGPNGEWSLQEPVCVVVDCGSLQSPQNGGVVLTDTTFRSTARYSCDPGFGLVGVSVRSCQANGQWSGDAPTCQISQCPDLDPPTGGNIETTGTNFWDTATYTCDSGFNLVGVATRTCQANGAWSGTPPFCSPVQCPVLEPPKDGQVQFTSTTFGAVATYKCHNGFVLVGIEEQTCQESGTWSGTAPICRRVECGILTPPKNGDISFSQGTVYGSVATYSCEPPFQLEGTATRVCQDDGEWSGHAPTCQTLECPDLNSPENGNVIQSGSISGSTARYTCDSGFSLIGDEIRICLANGFWTGVTPLCQPSDCDPLKPPDGGDVVMSGTTIGSKATYSCESGFNLVGDEFRHCQDDGEWSGTEATCAGIDCGPLTDPTNGVVDLTGTSVGDSATYRCNTGFVVFGKGIRECNQDGSWNGKSPECRVVDCGRLLHPPNGFVTFTDTTFGFTATYSCDNGFILVGFSSRVCEISGSWFGEEPSCIASVCPTLIPPTNGNVIQNGNEFGDTAVYTCEPGFRLSGTRIRTCLDGGQWSGTASTCDAVDCGNLQSPDNGRIIFLDGTSFGSVARYECNNGFVLIGIPIRSCDEDGNWSGEAPVCQIMQCGSLGDPADGRVSLSGVSFGAEATYTCITGFILVGTEIRTCLADGSWTGVAPICLEQEAFDCGRLDAPQNGRVRITGTRPGAVASYSCNVGFNLEGGNENRRCVDVFGWDGTAPTCQPIDCGTLESPPNGQVLLLHTTLGSSAMYNCFQGYLLLGTTIRRCEANGEWSGVEPVCSPTDCGNLANPQNGAVLVTGTTLGSTATYTCEENFSLLGPSIRVCGSDGVWSGRAPTCNRVGPIGCGDPGIPQNGRRNGDDFRLGATVYYECNDNFQLVGPASRICQNSGLWDGFLPTCSPIAGTNECSNVGGTVYDGCGRRCTCVGGQFVNCCRLRTDFASLSQENKRRLISTIITVASDPQIKPRYDALIALYKSSFDTLAQSSDPIVSQFLPWNRFFLIQYENLLREVDCRITLPYWDWTALPLNSYMAPVFSPESGFGDSSRANDSCVSNGPFNFGVFTITPSAGGGCLQRQYRMQMFPTRAIVEQDLLTLSAENFNQFHQFLQVFIHTNVRCFVGGQMCSTDAANDPLYLLHLVQIDFLFDRWQSVNSSRLNARFTGDNRPLSLSSGSTISQFASNRALANDICLTYDHPQFKTHVPPSMRFLADALEQMTNNHNLKMECVGDSVMKNSGIESSGEEFMHKMCVAENSQ